MKYWVVAYDIPDDNRRVRVAKLLDGFGDRVQHSVFEVCLDHTSLDHLHRRLQREIDPEKDAVRLYPLCEQCMHGVHDLGTAEAAPFEEPDVIIV